MNQLEKYVKENMGRLEGNHYIYNFNVRQPWFNLIKNGDKTVEGRLNTGKFMSLKTGDVIEWTCDNQKCNVMISYITKYRSFKEMLEIEGISNVLPVYYITSAEEGVKVYRQFYDELKERQHGVLAIGMVRIINDNDKK